MLESEVVAGKGRYAELVFELSKSAYIDSGYFDIAAENIALTAAQAGQLQYASVWILERDQPDHLRCAGEVVKGAVSLLDDLHLREQACPALFVAMRENRTLSGASDGLGNELRQFSAQVTGASSCGSWLVMPFRFEGRVAGVICCGDQGSREWSNEDHQLLASLTEIAARALAAEARQRAEDALSIARTSIEAQVAERTKSLRQALGQLQQTQQQLIQAEKMAALGALVAGVAHEINTPLGISVTAASHLRTSLLDIKALAESGRLSRVQFQEFLADAEEGASILLRNLERAAQLVTSFKRVAVHQSDECLSDFDLRMALEDLIFSLGPACRKEDVRIQLSCPPAIVLRSYVGALEQIVSNLVVNCLRHAFDGTGGLIDIVVVPGGDEVRIDIVDDGVGIESALLPRIFDPFVTTKRDRGGTGLGLHIVLNLVSHRLHGKIDVTSEVGHGTTFSLLLPRRLSAEAIKPAVQAAC